MAEIVDIEPHRRRHEWVRGSDAIKPNRAPTPQETEAIEEVLSLATDYDGTAPKLFAAMRATSPKQRRLAMLFTDPSHSQFRALRQLIDAILISERRCIVTKHGVFTEEELASVGAKIERQDGHELVVFPVRYVNGEPVYRPASERGPHLSSFRQGAHETPADKPKEWWER